MRSIRDGASLELTDALGLGADRFPMQTLAPSVEELERRSTTDSDTVMVPRSWVDRLFYGSAAARLGITFESVPAGVTSYPVTTAGGSSGQRAKGQAATAADWTIGVTELRPTRNAIYGVFSIEDVARVPSLEDALIRDLRGAIVPKIDKSIFSGDSGATGTDADIVGLKTAEISEVTITQANKVKADKVLEKFEELLDGLYAESLAD